MSPIAEKEKNSVFRPSWALRMRRRLERGFGLFIFWLAQRLPRKAALGLATWLGDVFFTLFKKYRMVCLDGLTIAFGDKYSHEEKLSIARNSERNMARTVMDFLRFGLYSKEELLSLCTRVDGIEYFEKAIEKSPGGVIGITAHIGSWEYNGAWAVASGWPLVAVGKEQRDPGITKLMLDIRAKVGIRHISSRKKGMPEMIRALKTKGTVLGLISDQNGGKDGIFVDFFGVPASSVKGPAFLALRYKVPVIPVFTLWDGDNYRIEVHPEVEIVRTGDEDADVLENTQRIQKVIEGMVRKYPDQWLWPHRRWKTRPPGEPPLHKN